MVALGEMLWCECCRAFTGCECWVSRALVASETLPPCAEPGKGRKNGHRPPSVDLSGKYGRDQFMNVGGPVSEVVEGGGPIRGSE